MRDAEWEWKAQQHIENAQRRAQEATAAAFRHEEASAQAKAEMDALRAENEALRWQSIETAPRNGNWLLLGYYNGNNKWRTVVGQWFSQEQINDEWEEPEDAPVGWYELSMEADEPPNCWYIQPTHWMPMPEPPQEVTR